MAETSITILDAEDAEVEVATRQPGGSGPHIQTFEHKVVSSYLNINLLATGQVVLGVAAILHNWEVFNTDTGPIYVKLYNKATAADENDTPIRVWEVMPGTSPFVGEVVSGISFALGLSVRCTTGRAHDSTAAPTANTCLINLGYRAG